MSRILFLIENLGSGGAERQLTGLAVMLNQHGYQVEVCYYVKKEFYLPFLQENGVESCFLSEASNHKKRFFALREHIISFKPDTVISYSTSPSLITCLLKRLGGSFNLIVSERNTTQKRGKEERLKFFLYKFADHIVPNSQSQADFINFYFPSLSNKVKVITNFVDTDKFSPLNNVKLKHEGTQIICVGRLMPQKNVPSFIKAISRVINDGYIIHVDWFGMDLLDSYSDECHTAISNCGLNNVFEFHTPSSSIEDEYLRADVFCLPSLYEGFPNVLCEAMSCGLPVLCSRVCDNPNIVQHGNNGLLFDPMSVEDMALTIETYLDLSEEKKECMGRISRELAISRFSKDSFIQKYISIL